MRSPIAVATTVLVLGLAACGGSDSGSAANGSTPAPSSPSASADPQVVTIHESEFKLDPAQVAVKSGSVSFKLTDDGRFPHDLHIAPKGTTNEVGASSRMQSGGTTTLTVTLQPGVYDMWCGVPGHRDAGMQGTVTVT